MLTIPFLRQTICRLLSPPSTTSGSGSELILSERQSTLALHNNNFADSDAFLLHQFEYSKFILLVIHKC
jgi:hypothetical protein